MTRDLNEPTDRHDDGHPAPRSRPRWTLSARVAAVAGLSVVAIMAAGATALAGPAPTQAGSFNDCISQSVARITAEAAVLPANQRSAYIRAQTELARARCGAILSSIIASPTTSPSTTTTTTTTTSPTTTTSSSTSTTTTSTTPTTPSTTTTTTSPGNYTIIVTGVIGVGQQTLRAQCRAGDRLVDYDTFVDNPTGSNTSRNVSVSSNNRGVTLTYEVRGTVPNPTTSLTIRCRTGS